MTGKNRQTLHDALEAELAPVRLSASRKAAILAAAGGAEALRRGGACCCGCRCAWPCVPPWR